MHTVTPTCQMYSKAFAFDACDVAHDLLCFSKYWLSCIALIKPAALQDNQTDV